MKKILKYKFFIVLSILFCCLAFYCSTSFAADSSFWVEYKGSEIEFPSLNTIDFSSRSELSNYDSNCDYFIVYAWDAFRIYFLPKDYNCKVEHYYSSQFGTYGFHTSDETQCAQFYLNDGKWDFVYLASWVDHLDSTAPFVYSTVDIYKDGTNDVFFQKAPMTAVQIPTLETVGEIPTAMVTVLKKIIPIGLAILSIGFLILLIKSVIWRMK